MNNLLEDIQNIKLNILILRINKSLIEKKLPVGTIREWENGKYRKMPNGEWEKIPEGKKEEHKENESFQIKPKNDYTINEKGEIILSNGIKIPADKKNIFLKIKKEYSKKSKGQGISKPIENKDELDTILNYTKYGLISSGRNPNIPEEKKLTDQQLKERFEKLKNKLIESGYVYTEQIGKYGEEEPSLIVMLHDSNKEDLIKLGKEFNQDSIIYTEYKKSEMIGTSNYNMNKILMEGNSYDYYGDERNDYYSEINIGNKKIKYGLNLKEIIEKALKSLYQIVRKVFLINDKKFKKSC